MPHPEREHALQIELATALRERDVERKFRRAAEAAFAEQLARTEKAEAALAAARRECEELRKALQFVLGKCIDADPRSELAKEIERVVNGALVQAVNAVYPPSRVEQDAALAAPGDGGDPNLDDGSFYEQGGGGHDD